MPHPNHETPDQYPMETLAKVPMEDKLILAAEEEYPSVPDLTPGEIDSIIRRVLRSLPEELTDGDGEDIIVDCCYEVAYSVMNRMIG